MGSLLFIVFKVWVEFFVRQVSNFMCVYCVISMSFESLFYLMCDSFFLCVSKCQVLGVFVLCFFKL